MDRYDSLTTPELEALIPEGMRDCLRSLYRDSNEYREYVIQYLREPKIPIDDLLAAVRSWSDAGASWHSLLEVCQRAAPGAPWAQLPVPDIRGDIENARAWLSEELFFLYEATGLYLGLDSLNMRKGLGHNVEIGGTPNCDPLQDSQEWLYQPGRRLTYGARHLIRGLYELHEVFTQKPWLVADLTVPSQNYSSFASYALFLGYSGIVLGHALARLEVDRTLLVVWGFHDGDLFLLGRRTEKGFAFLCK